MSVLDEIRRDINKNYFISASAGTGKTFTITNYYVEILKKYEKENYPEIVDEIVVVTFTRKAAAEMKERIVKLVNEEFSQSKNKEYWSKVKNNLSRAIISTIDSFCQRILREENINAKIDPSFSIISNAKMEKYIERAVFLTLRYVFQLFDFDEVSITCNIPSERKKQIKNYLEILKRYKDEIRKLFVNEYKDLNKFMETMKDVLKHWRAEMKRASVPEKLFSIDEIRSKSLEVFKYMLLISKEIYEGYTIDNFEFDFKAVLEKTLDFLEQDEMRKKYQKKFKYIIVDEFQDTNYLQKELFDKLHGEDNYLFYVGDRKQSIYRFRNADVSVFLETQNEFEKRGEKVLALKENYRSNYILVKYFNFISEKKIFSKTIIKNSKNEEVDEFEVFKTISPDLYNKLWYNKEFDESIPMRVYDGEIPALKDKNSRIKYVLVDNGGKNKKEREKSEALVAAYIIKNLVGKTMTVKEKDNYVKRKIKYSDFVILRSTLSNQEEVYKNVFKKFNIPLHVVSSKGFFERLEIKALLNALYAVQNPNNDFYFTQFFFSPLVLGKFGDYVKIVSKNTQLKKEGISDESLFQTAKKIKFDDEKVNKAIEVLAKYSQLKYFIRPAEVLKGLVRELNYFEKLVYFEDFQNAILNVKKLILDASAIDQMAESFSQLVKLIEKLSLENESEAATEDENSDSVKLMTIHASKGLEFKIVILGDIYSEEKKSNRNVMFSKERETTYYILRKFFDDLKQETKHDERIFEAIKEFYKDGVYDKTEDRRKLYVAITRASEMFIPIIFKDSKDNTLANYLKLSDQEKEELKGLIGDFEEVEIDVEKDINFDEESTKQVFEKKDIPQVHLKDLNGLAYKSYISPTTLYGYLGNEKEAKEEDILLLFDEKTSEGSDIHRKLSSVNTISQLRYLEEEKILKVKISDKLESLFKGANVISEWRVVKPFFVNDRRYMLFGIPDKVLFKGNKIYVLDFKNVDFKNSKNIEKYKFQIKFYMYLLKDFGAPEKGYIISTKTGEFIEVSLEENFEEKIKAAIENFESCKKVKA
ncbi:MAG: hypothetical protein PWQ45_51 [Thermosipho sp. (in: thermotogales)]|nr:hypothetical protein [Thermosipho sp. (in: thermotogales)]